MRLALISTELARQLTSSTPERQRRAAIVAAKFAVEQAMIDDRASLLALEELETRGAVTEARLNQLKVLAESFDEKYLSLQEESESGMATKESYVRAFSQARGLEAIIHASGEDPLEAAAEALYEAAATTDNPRELLEIARKTLTE